MKYNVFITIGALIVIISIFINTSLKHNSSEPVGTELTFIAAIIGFLIALGAEYFKWRNKKTAKKNDNN